MTETENPYKHPPQNCPFCNGQADWSGIGNMAHCLFCGLSYAAKSQVKQQKEKKS